MSWKGLQKAVSRLPHQIMSKKTDVTRDEEYMAQERRFNDLFKVVERLQQDALAFRDGVVALLGHQAAMVSFITAIYDTQLGIQPAEGEVQRRFQQTPAEAMQAACDAEAAMGYCRDEVLPELDAVDRDVVRPTLELRDIMKTIQKNMTKRDHKMIDYDRHRSSMSKLKAKEERSFSEEKQIFKIEAQLETATQDYNYMNDMLKQELPRFFHLKAEFIHPVLERFYYLQCRIYGMIYARCHELVNANKDHFVTLQMPLEEGYNWRKAQRDMQAELENLDLLKSGGKAWLTVSGGSNNSKLSLKERAALKQKEAEQQQNDYASSTSPPPPAYSTAAPTAYAPPQAAAQPRSPAAFGTYSRPPVQAPAPPSGGDYVIALYDFDAQAEGDLSFRKDDKIEVVQRSQDENDWWTGRLRGQTGIFPGNYVAPL